MRSDLPQSSPLDEILAEVHRAEVRYMAAYRARSELPHGDPPEVERVDTELRQTREALRRIADRALRRLSREVGADLDEPVDDDGFTVSLEDRVVWYDFDSDPANPGWFGRDAQRGDTRLIDAELEHWLRAGRVSRT